MKTKRKIKKIKTKKRGGKIFTMRHFRTISGYATEEDKRKNERVQQLKQLKKDIENLIDKINFLIITSERLIIDDNYLEELETNIDTDEERRKFQEIIKKLEEINNQVKQMKKSVNRDNIDTLKNNFCEIIEEVDTLYSQAKFFINSYLEKTNTYLTTTWDDDNDKKRQYIQKINEKIENKIGGINVSIESNLINLDRLFHHNCINKESRTIDDDPVFV